MDVRKRIGWNLRRLRKERGISQEDFATDSGFDRGYISGVERGFAIRRRSCSNELRRLLVWTSPSCSTSNERSSAATTPMADFGRLGTVSFKRTA